MPQLTGQLVSLVKETSVVGFIAVQDLTRAGDLIRSRTMEAFFPLVAIAIIYFALCRFLAWGLRKAMNRYQVQNRPRVIKGVKL
jgi:polar amino acid transport system substrate-binding protein